MPCVIPSLWTRLPVNPQRAGWGTADRRGRLCPKYLSLRGWTGSSKMEEAQCNQLTIQDCLTSSRTSATLGAQHWSLWLTGWAVRGSCSWTGLGPWEFLSSGPYITSSLHLGYSIHVPSAGSAAAGDEGWLMQRGEPSCLRDHSVPLPWWMPSGWQKCDSEITLCAHSHNSIHMPLPQTTGPRAHSSLPSRPLTSQPGHWLLLWLCIQLILIIGRFLCLPTHLLAKIYLEPQNQCSWCFHSHL